LGNLFPEARRIPVERTVGYWVSGKRAASGVTVGELDGQLEEQREQLLELVLERSLIYPEQVHLSSSKLLDELKKRSRYIPLEEPEDWWYTG